MGAVRIPWQAAVGLAGLHIAAAWLAAGREPAASERRRGLTIAAAAMTATSLVTIGARGVCAPAPAFALAGAAVAGALLVARTRPLGFDEQTSLGRERSQPALTLTRAGGCHGQPAWATMYS